MDLPRRPKPQKPQLMGAAGPSRPSQSPGLIPLNFKGCCKRRGRGILEDTTVQYVVLAAFSQASAGAAAAASAGTARRGCGTAPARAQARHAPWLVQPGE